MITEIIESLQDWLDKGNSLEEIEEKVRHYMPSIEDKEERRYCQNFLDFCLDAELDGPSRENVLLAENLIHHSAALV
jgi:hypothetical protein